MQASILYLKSTFHLRVHSYSFSCIYYSDLTLYPVNLKVPHSTDKCVHCSCALEECTPCVEGTAENAAEGSDSVNKDHSGTGVFICTKKQLLSN